MEHQSNHRTDHSDVPFVMGGTGSVPTEFITGPAGTGKTFMLKQRIEDDPHYAKLTATTGIAAVNLDTVTINSALKFFDLDSLEEAFHTGWLEQSMRRIADGSEDEYDAEPGQRKGYRALAIDEVSMLGGPKLNVVHETAKRVNEARERRGEEPLGLILTGDFCQLPPVNEPWAFEAQCWPEFERNITRLTKYWRQTDEQFLEALRLARLGKGYETADILAKICEFASHTTQSFPGTTIISRNKQVDNYNWLRQSKVNGRIQTVFAQRWGDQRGEWKQKRDGTWLIPPSQAFKIGDLVMILANEPRTFSYVNGDCGIITDWLEEPRWAQGTFIIKLNRNDREVAIGPLPRSVTVKHLPRMYDTPDADEKALKLQHELDWDGEYVQGGLESTSPQGKPFWGRPTTGRGKSPKWVTGQIQYYPMRLAYATTVHKSQGLSLDAVQIDLNDWFIGKPGMVYVALSRCRTPQGLRIVGTKDMLARKINTDPKVVKWL